MLGTSFNRTLCNAYKSALKQAASGIDSKDKVLEKYLEENEEEMQQYYSECLKNLISTETFYVSTKEEAEQVGMLQSKHLSSSIFSLHLFVYLS